MKARLSLVTRILLLTVCCTLAVSSMALAKVELTLMVSNATAWLDFHKAAIAEFEAANPDIKVNMVAGTIQNLKVQLAAGVQIDSFYLPGDTFTECVTPGLLAALQPLVNKDSSFKLNEYYPAALNAHRYNGALYGIPAVVSPTAVIYNKTLFSEAGVPYPSKTPTWDAVISASKKLIKDKTGDGVVDQMAWSYANFSAYNRFPMYIWQNGGDIFSADNSKVVMDSPASVEALKFYRDLGSVHGIAVLPTDPILKGTSYGSLFNNGKVAMVTQTRFFNPPSTMDYDIMHMPAGKTNATTLITNYYGILANSKYPNEAWRLVRFMLEVPTRKGLLDKAAPAFPAYRPNAMAFIKAEIEAANGKHNELVWLEAMEYARGPYYPPISDWAGFVNKYFTKYGNGELTAQAMSEQFSTEANALLAELKK